MKVHIIENTYDTQFEFIYKDDDNIIVIEAEICNRCHEFCNEPFTSRYNYSEKIYCQCM
jgi:hypothetical protein